MPATVDGNKKSGFIEMIWEQLDALTEESKQAALLKCTESEFDANAGAVTLDESYVNLADDKQVLRESIENRKLVQLPITVQRQLKAALDNVVKFERELAAGTDQVVNLVGAIEQVHVAVWQYRLGHMTEQLVGYETKSNQLKTLRRETTKMKEELNQGLELKQSVEELLAELTKRRDGINEELDKATTEAAALAKNAASTQKLSQDADAKLRAIQQSETASADSLARIKASHAEATKIEEGLTKFYQKVDETRTKVTKLDEDSQRLVKEQKEQVDKLVSRLNELEDKIADQIEKATGFSLFDSFLKRRDSLSKSKYIWAGAGLVFLLGLVILTLYLTKQPMDFNHVFWLRLAIAVPLGFALYFCLHQYSTERRLEEEYNFRANISTSLVPYKDIVKELVSEADYAKFIIETIEKVFTSPTDKVFADAEKNADMFSDKNLKKADTWLTMARKHLTIPGLPTPG